MVSTAANCAKVQTQVRVSQVTAGTIGGQYFKVDFHMPEDTGDGGNSTVEIEDYWIEMSNESAFPAGASTRSFEVSPEGPDMSYHTTRIVSSTLVFGQVRERTLKAVPAALTIRTSHRMRLRVVTLFNLSPGIFLQGPSRKFNWKRLMVCNPFATSHQPPGSSQRPRGRTLAHLSQRFA
jgi:hypothetical protein